MKRRREAERDTEKKEERSTPRLRTRWPRSGGAPSPSRLSEPEATSCADSPAEVLSPQWRGAVAAPHNIAIKLRSLIVSRSASKIRIRLAPRGSLMASSLRHRHPEFVDEVCRQQLNLATNPTRFAGGSALSSAIVIIVHYAAHIPYTGRVRPNPVVGVAPLLAYKRCACAQYP